MDVTSESKYNDSILELSKEDLQSELLKFQSMCKDYQQIIEDRNQDVHVLKRQVISLMALEQEYQQEIEYITSTKSKKCKILEDRIQELESIQKTSLNNENEESLLDECRNLKKTIVELEKKLNTTQPSTDRGDIEALIEENDDLKSKYSYFAHTRHPVILQELQEQKDLVKQLTEELEDVRKTYASNSANTKVKLDEQEEQIALMRVELSNAQRAQQEETHEARGNSMFSEVYDNWVRLKKKNEDLVRAYQESRVERNKLRSESSVLRRYNSSMCARWETECSEAERCDRDLISAYKYDIEKYEHLVKKYEEELARERNVNYKTPGTHAEVYVNMIKSKNEQIDQMYKEYCQPNGSSIMHRVEIREVNSKARRYLAEAAQYKTHIEQLQEQIQQLQTTNTQSNNAITVENDRKPMCDVATMTIIDRKPLLAKPVRLLNEVCQNCKENFSMATVGEIVKCDSKIADDCTKENVRKVHFVEDASTSAVNEQRRRPRPRGKPIDCSQMIVVKRQTPKKL